MKRDRKQRRILLLLVLLLGVTIGFALLSTTLKINGTAGIKSSTWDIHWENVQPNSQSTVTAQTPVISEHATKVSYEVTLELPGDFYEFTVDAKNDGSVNGEITDVRHSVKEVTIENNEEVETTATLPSYIHSTVYYNGTTTPPAIGDILAAGEKQTYVVRIEYDEDSEELPPTDKTYRVTTEIDYGQTKKDPVISLDDVVYFDPVNYEFCDANKSSESCYKWVTISRKNGSIYELFLLDKLDSFAYTQNNLADIISSATTTWDNRLKNVDTSYDFEPAAGYNINFSTTKARMLLKSEYDALDSKAKDLISQNCGLVEAGKYCAGLNEIDSFVGNITPGGMGNTYPYSLIPSATLGSNYTVRPVIKLDLKNDDIGNKTKPSNNKKYNPGDEVYFDPVSNDICDENTFTYNDVERVLQKYDSSTPGYQSYKKVGTSTCYKWRVIDTADTTKDKTVTLQLDHNIIQTSAWRVSGGVMSDPPAVMLSNLASVTSNWTRVPLLDYDYTRSNTKYNYGELLCRRGTCMIPAASTICRSSNCEQSLTTKTLATNLRARVITGEELAALGELSNWSSAAENYPSPYSFNSNVAWLREHTYKYPTEYSGLNKYYSEDDLVDSGDGYVMVNSTGYWTLTDANQGDVWIYDASSPQKLEYWVDATSYGYNGIRPVIEIEKSKLN